MFSGSWGACSTLDDRPGVKKAKYISAGAAGHVDLHWGN